MHVNIINESRYQNNDALPDITLTFISDVILRANREKKKTTQR